MPRHDEKGINVSEDKRKMAGKKKIATKVVNRTS